MSWNAMSYEGKDTVLRVVREQADSFFALAAEPETWTAQTACPEWEVRDIVGHIVDTTEGYFPAFDAARRHLAAFKVPVRVLFQTEPLTRNPNGKIMKGELKKLFA